MVEFCVYFFKFCDLVVFLLDVTSGLVIFEGSAVPCALSPLSLSLAFFNDACWLLRQLSLCPHLQFREAWRMHSLQLARVSEESNHTVR